MQHESRGILERQSESKPETLIFGKRPEAQEVRRAFVVKAVDRSSRRRRAASRRNQFTLCQGPLAVRFVLEAGRRDRRIPQGAPLPGSG